MAKKLEELKAVAWMAYGAIDDECADDPDEFWVTWIDAFIFLAAPPLA